MPPKSKTDVAVVGSGIVGLAVAYAAARQGKTVAVFERNSQAVGASIRNFGLIWPIGQPPGPLLQRALRSREIWLELAEAAGFWINRSGSLHLAYHADEQAVLEEFYQTAVGSGYQVEWLSPQEVMQRSPAVRPEGLRGGLYSATELTVQPARGLAQATPVPGRRARGYLSLRPCGKSH